MLLTLVGLIGGATSIAKVCAVWSDGVLAKIAGWFQLPAETTISRLFKEVDAKQIAQLETLNHRLRGRLWRKAQRTGVSKVGLKPTQWRGHRLHRRYGVWSSGGSG